MNVKLPHVSFFLLDSASNLLLIFWLDFFSLPFPFPLCSHPIRLSPSASSLLRFLFPVLFFSGLENFPAPFFCFWCLCFKGHQVFTEFLFY